MYRFFLIILTLTIPLMGNARVLTLDSCRSLALSNNKELLMAGNQTKMASYEHKIAQTNYLPKVSLDGAYLWNQKRTELLSDDNKAQLRNLPNKFGQTATALAQQDPSLAPLLQSLGTPLASMLGGMGEQVIDAFSTNTHNIYAGSLILVQPLYMGGKIKAYNEITKYTEKLLGAKYDKMASDLICSVDQTYWQIVSLSEKKVLAKSYVSMLQKLDDDIQKMYKEGVTTKAATLTVSVKLNEAEMSLTKVEDALSLSRMLLCQICSLPVSLDFTLADEGNKELPSSLEATEADTLQAFSQRKDLQALGAAIKIADENIKIVRSAFLPSLSAFGGYTITNPNVYNGFRNNFAGNLNIGVTLHVPIWSWNEGKWKMRKAKLYAENQRLMMQNAKEKIALQVNQARFKANEAQKKLETTRRNQLKAEENLHYADIGFHEGVISAADMLQAQTAWLQAKSDRLDAEIDVRLTQIYLENSLGTLKY